MLSCKKYLSSNILVISNVFLIVSILWYLLTFYGFNVDFDWLPYLPIEVVYVIFIITNCIKFYCIKNNLCEKYVYIINTTLLSLLIILVIQLNTGQGISWLYNILFNVLIIVIPISIILLLFNKRNRYIGYSLIFIFFILLDIFSIILYNVYMYRGTSFTWNDLQGINTLMGVINDYKPVWSKHIIEAQIIMLLIFIYLFVYLFNSSYFKNTYEVIDYNSSSSWYKFMIIISVISLLIGSEKALSVNVWSYLYGRSATGIIQNLYHMYIVRDVKEPKDYDLYKNFCMDLDFSINNKYEDIIKPDIIIVMNESFSDIRKLNNLELSDNPLKNYDKLSTISGIKKGNIVVPYIGGLTCNTEFEVLTGLSNILFNYGYIPYMQCISQKVDTYLSYFNNLGYSTTAIHPFWSICWNRSIVYDLFGFDKTIFGEDLNNLERINRWSGDTEHNYLKFGNEYEYIRTYISDKQNYEFIKDELEKSNTDEPKFIFNVTIQNHGSYKNYDGVELNNSIKILNDIDDKDSAEQYINLINISDDALKDLIDYCSKRERPTVLCIFGDHLPALECNFGISTLEHFKTPYFMYKNYEIDNQQVEFEDFSSNYLMYKLLEFSGMPLDNTSKYLKDIYDKYPIIGINSGILDASGDNVGSFENTLGDYLSLIYYRLFDK